MLSSLFGAKVGAALAAGVISFGGVSAAAYTGVLPSGLQNLAHTTVGAPAADVGESADTGTADDTKKADDAKKAKKADDAKKTDDTKKAGVGPDAAGPAAFGLCNAWQHVKVHSEAVKKSVAFRNLATAAGGAEKVATYCAKITHPGADTTKKTHPTGKPSTSPSGKPSSHPTGKPSTSASDKSSSHPAGQ